MIVIASNYVYLNTTLVRQIIPVKLKSSGMFSWNIGMNNSCCIENTVTVALNTIVSNKTVTESLFPNALWKGMHSIRWRNFYIRIRRINCGSCVVNLFCTALGNCLISRDESNFVSATGYFFFFLKLFTMFVFFLNGTGKAAVWLLCSVVTVLLFDQVS